MLEMVLRFLFVYGILLIFGLMSLTLCYSVEAFEAASTSNLNENIFSRPMTSIELWQMRRGVFNDSLIFILTNLIVGLSNEKIICIIAKGFGFLHCLSLTIMGPMYGLWLSEQPSLKKELNSDVFNQHIYFCTALTVYSLIGFIWVLFEPNQSNSNENVSKEEKPKSQ